MGEIGSESTRGAGFYLVLARRLCQRYYTADSQGNEGGKERGGASTSNTGGKVVF